MQRAISVTSLFFSLVVLVHHDPARLPLTRVEDGQRCQGRRLRKHDILSTLTRPRRDNWRPPAAGHAIAEVHWQAPIYARHFDSIRYLQTSSCDATVSGPC